MRKHDELISRAAAIDVMLAALDDDWESDYAKDRMCELPAAQPEIIRCMDCLMHGVCRFEKAFGLDGYCSQAEKR